MKWFVRQGPMPTTDERIYRIEHKLPTGEQMRTEVKRKLDAGEPLGANHVTDYTEIEARVLGSMNYDGAISGKRFEASDKRRWPCRGDARKHVSEKYCGGIVCQMGLNGKCVACGEDY